MSDVDLRELADEILTEMYEEAEPSRDFMELRENPEEAEDEWYMNHYLSGERCREIFEKHTEDVDLTSAEHASLSLECLTSLAPTSTPPEEQHD